LHFIANRFPPRRHSLPTAQEIASTCDRQSLPATVSFEERPDAFRRRSTCSESFDQHDNIAVADFTRGVEVFALDGTTPLSSFDEGSAPFTVIFDTKHKRAFVGRNDPQKGVDVYRYPSEEFVTTILQYPEVHVDDLAFGPAASP
jgi:hypothetical protein